MKTTISFLALVSCLGLGAEYATDYTRERGLRIETKLSLEMETTESRMERDGQPVEGRGGGDSEEARTVVQIDRFLAHADGLPTHVKRTFEEIGGESSRTMGDNTMERSLDGQLAGVTLELKRGDDEEPKVTVADGEVDDPELLEGHRMELALDSLLPDGEVEEGATWELSEEAIERALGLDIAAVVFKAAEEDGAPSGGGEGGRGGGRGFGGRMGGGDFSSLQHVEWKGTATLVELDDDHEGEICARIEVEFEGEGELPAPEFGRGRDRELAFAAGWPAPMRAENSIEAKLGGNFWFAIEGRRPRALDLSGELTSKMSLEGESERGSFSMSSTREGKCDFAVHIQEEE